MPRAPKKCGRHDCHTRVPGSRTYCDIHTAELQRRGNTTARGYGAPHQKERAYWEPIVRAGGVRCWRCSELIVHNPNVRGGGWDVGHDDHDRRITRGPEHARRCNRATSSRRARPPDPYT